MSISHSSTPTHHTDMLVRKLAQLAGPCIGCKDCDGLCSTLIDALVLPDLILARRDSSC